jgi:hypothetical protein
MTGFLNELKGEVNALMNLNQHRKPQSKWILKQQPDPMQELFKSFSSSSSSLSK